MENAIRKESVEATLLFKIVFFNLEYSFLFLERFLFFYILHISSRALWRMISTLGFSQWKDRNYFRPVIPSRSIFGTIKTVPIIICKKNIFKFIRLHQKSETFLFLFAIEKNRQKNRPNLLSRYLWDR